jgi:hypothetical protein
MVHALSVRVRTRRPSGETQKLHARVSTPFSSRQPLSTPQRELALHKVLTYTEHRALSGVFRTIDPPPPLHPANVSSPRTKGEGYTLAGR